MHRAEYGRTLVVSSLAASTALHAGALVALAGFYTIADRPAELRFASGSGGLEVNLSWERGAHEAAGPESPAAPVPEIARPPVLERIPEPANPPETVEPAALAIEAPPVPPEPEPDPAPGALAPAGASIAEAPPPHPPEPAPELPPPDRGPQASAPHAGGGPAGLPGERSSARPGASISPRYPDSCRRLGHSGTVLLECDVSPAGRVTRVEVIGSTGCGELDRAAVVALQRAVFVPAIEAGRPVAARVKQPVTFQLRRGG